MGQLCQRSLGKLRKHGDDECHCFTFAHLRRRGSSRKPVADVASTSSTSPAAGSSGAGGANTSEAEGSICLWELVCSEQIWPSRRKAPLSVLEGILPLSWMDALHAGDALPQAAAATQIALVALAPLSRKSHSALEEQLATQLFRNLGVPACPPATRVRLALLAAANVAPSMQPAPPARWPCAAQTETTPEVQALFAAPWLVEFDSVRLRLKYDSNPTPSSWNNEAEMEEERAGYFEEVAARVSGSLDLVGAWETLTGEACNINGLCEALVWSVCRGEASSTALLHPLAAGPRRLKAMPVPEEERRARPWQNLRVAGLAVRVAATCSLYEQGMEPTATLLPSQCVRLYYERGLAELSCRCRIVGF